MLGFGFGVDVLAHVKPSSLHRFGRSKRRLEIEPDHRGFGGFGFWGLGRPLARRSEAEDFGPTSGTDD